MNATNYIPVSQLCMAYELEFSFFEQLNAFQLIHLHRDDDVYFIEESELHAFERILRMHNELELNMEGIDVVFNLLQKIDNLEKENTELKNRLRLFEDPLY